MNTALIPHPRFSTSSPIVTAREMVLAAACLGLKGQLIVQATKITRLEEDKRALTRALHHTACAGHALPEVLGLITLVGVALTIRQILGSHALVAYVIGFGLGLAWMILLLMRAAPARNTARPRQHPAHIDEPMSDVQIIEAIRRRDLPLGAAYADESEFEPFERAIPTHPEALTRQLNELIPARERFEHTAQALQTA